jgi:exosome complex component RRP45
MFNPISNNEKKFLLSNLTNNLRSDERKLLDYREIKLTKLRENGQIQLELGKTLIISQVFAKLINTTKDRPNEGVIVFSVNSIILKID